MTTDKAENRFRLFFAPDFVPTLSNSPRKDIPMKVGILGSGNVGQTLATGSVKHGHEVVSGTRDPNSDEIRKFLATTPKASAGTFAEAAKFGDILVLAVLGRAVEQVISLAGPNNFGGKTVIDTSNPIAAAPPENGVLRFTTGPNESWLKKSEPCFHRPMS
jgi:8-hydroxy-5-deazaflavin:NADPH oxidoreductase